MLYYTTFKVRILPFYILQSSQTSGVGGRLFNELEFIKGEIWANIFREDIIVRISPATGNVLGWVDLSQLYSLIPEHNQIDVLNGIAYDRDRDRIFVTGKLWPKIFEIKVVEPHSAGAEGSLK
jgi:glutamine cyclotransferase